MLCKHVLPSKGLSITLILFVGYSSMAFGSELIAAVPDSAQSTGAAEPKPSPKGSAAANTLPGSPQRNPAPTLDDLFAKVAARVPQFGGMYVNSEQTLEVFLTDTNPSVLETARQAAVEVFGAERIRRGGFNPILGKYGFLQLQDMHRRARDILALPGVISLDTDERKNRLKVGLSRLEVQADVEKRLAALKIPLEAVIFEKMAPMRMLAWDPDPTDRTRPAVGGTQIVINNIKRCTIGFIASRAGVNGFVTNSHCTSHRGTVDGDVFDQPNRAAAMAPSNRVGTETVDPPLFTGGNCPSGRQCRVSDSAFITMPPGVTGHFGQIIHPDHNFPSNFSIRGTSMPFSGDYVNKVGSTTGWTGGKVDDTCADFNQDDGKGNDSGITALCQNTVAAFSAHGDSGSPVFEYLTNVTKDPFDPYAVLLVGILWGGNDSIFGYSPIFNVMLDLGLDPDFADIDHAPTVAITNPPNNASVPYGGFSSMTFSAAVSDFEGGANCCTVTWESDKDGSMGTGANIQYSFFTPGTRKITAHAKDSSGNPATASIQVQTSNGPPDVWILKPAKGATLYSGGSYMFNGASFDPEIFSALPCKNLRWNSSNPQDTPSFPQTGCSVQVSFKSAGPRTVVLEGVDAEGVPGAVAVNITVVDPPANGPPVVTIVNPENDEIVAPHNAVSLRGIVKDPGVRNPISYRWMMKGTPNILIAQGAAQNNQAFSNIWKPSAQQLPHHCGDYSITVELEATDADNHTASDSVQLSVIYPAC